jgi:hypothetical protein
LKHPFITEVLLVAAVLGVGCLPADDRPEPGQILVTGEASAAIPDGFATADGWTISFDRFVTALGDIRLHDEKGRDGSCNDYAQTRYNWLFDFTVAGREKIGLAHGLGTCSVEFELGPPDFDGVLGPGVSVSDRDAMRIRNSDAFVDDERISIIAQGVATRGDASIRFDWAFRRGFEYSECPGEGGGFVSVVDANGGDALELNVIVSGEVLFQQEATADAPHLFQSMADGDADGDGNVTLAELDEVMADTVTDDDEPQSLLEQIYTVQLPRIARFIGGHDCDAKVD